MEEMSFEDWAELMSEPPHGHNHGRSKTGAGGWETLETDPADVRDPQLGLISAKRYVEEPRAHGTAYLYVDLKCRCPKCRAWNAARRLRQRGVAGA